MRAEDAKREDGARCRRWVSIVNATNLLKTRKKDARVFAVEKYITPLNCMMANVNLLGIDIEILAGSLLEPILERRLYGKIDLIVANPPYIMTKL